MSSQKLVHAANKQLDSLKGTERLQQHARANDGKGTEWLQKRLKVTQRPMFKDDETGLFHFA